MKILILTTLLLVSLSAMAQKNKSTPAQSLKGSVVNLPEVQTFGTPMNGQVTCIDCVIKYSCDPDCIQEFCGGVVPAQCKGEDTSKTNNPNKKKKTTEDGEQENPDEDMAPSV